MERRIPFVTSRAEVNNRRIILIAIKDVNGCQGWGECSAPEEPRYCEEWTDSAWEVINRLLIPVILAERNVSTGSIRELFERYRGNRMAKAAIEAACWDLEARQKNIPLWKLLGGKADPIQCGVALGIMNSVDDLMQCIENELNSGYRRIKLKIQPGWDIKIVEAVRTKYPSITLMVDANGAYRIDDLNVLRALDQFDLLMIEQPFAPDDLAAYQNLQQSLHTPVCLDESVVSVMSAKAALEFSLCKSLNVKLGRVGGYSEAKDIVNLCVDRRFSCWCGGQHEAGIGKAHNIALATLMTREIPSELSASSRYWIEDIIVPEINVDEQGFLHPPVSPGFGFEVNQRLIDAKTERKVVHRA